MLTDDASGVPPPTHEDVAALPPLPVEIPQQRLAVRVGWGIATGLVAMAMILGFWATRLDNQHLQDRLQAVIGQRDKLADHVETNNRIDACLAQFNNRVESLRSRILRAIVHDAVQSPPNTVTRAEAEQLADELATQLDVLDEAYAAASRGEMPAGCP